MKITIGNKEVNYEVNGTVGLTFMVEQMTGEDFSFNNKKHVYYLYFATLLSSNKGDKDITLDWFLANLTAKEFKQMDEYTAQRWKELEGLQSEEEKEESDSKNE